MYGISKKLVVGLGFFVIALASMAQAQSQNPGSPAPSGQHRHHAKGFRRGVCVGQTLAKAGVILPQRVPGQRPVLDPDTKAAFKAAVQSCRAQAKANRTPAS
jgi:hypothetical protein